MKLNKSRPNVFIVETPHQLLNAIEAVRSLHLKHNHLVILGPSGFDRSRFIPLLEASKWASLRYLSPFISSRPWVRQLFGSTVYRSYCRLLHFRRMAILAGLSARFRRVDRLFLGHYCADEKPFMRHIANIVDYRELYLLDDGTDTIEINKSRKSHWNHQHPAPEIAHPMLSARRLLRHFVSSKYWTWSLAEAPHLTFFTVYDLEVRPGDSLIRNDYEWLRSRSVGHRISMPDTVVFIGQCIQDGNIELNAHLRFLARAREHFSQKNFIYVAHPRESASCLDRVRTSLKCEIWPSSSVIEQDMFGRGICPEAVAGFATSAHITLAYLMAPDIEIVCFELPPDCWLGWKAGASAFYEYVRKKMYPRITVIPLSTEECECLIPSSAMSTAKEM